MFGNFVAALARSPGISGVKIAIPSEMLEKVNRMVENDDKIEIKPFPIFVEVKRILGIPGTGRLQIALRKVTGRYTGQEGTLRKLSEDCDLLYCFWPHFFTFPDIEKPVICTIQDTILFDFPEIIGAGATYAEWEKQRTWITKCKKVVVSSDVSRLKVMEEFGVDSSKISVIRHDAVPDSKSMGNSDANEALPSLPRNFFVYPSNLSPHKNHYNLLVAWSRFERRRDYPLVFFGGGSEILYFKGPQWDVNLNWQQLRLVGLIKRLGLKPGEDFHALGYVPDELVLPIISRATGLIMPSFAEGGGSYPVEEALSVGVPVLCSDIPVMREHVGKRSAEIKWFDPYLPESIVRAVIDFLDDFKRVKESALRAMGDRRPTWEEIAAAYSAAFGELIK